MPKNPTANTVQVMIEFPTDFAEVVKAFAKNRGETRKAVVIAALRRHMANPPPIPVPAPLPDLPPLPPVAVAPAVKPAKKKK